jgi:hypothetical protein
MVFELLRFENKNGHHFEIVKGRNFILYTNLGIIHHTHTKFEVGISIGSKITASYVKYTTIP